jgi:hypothetical protein
VASAWGDDPKKMVGAIINPMINIFRIPGLMEDDGVPDRLDYDGDLGNTEDIFVTDANFIKGQVGKRA